MKVAVISPYYRTPLDWLNQCYQSVRAQTHSCTHFFVADGDPCPSVDNFDTHHIRLSGPHKDYGDTPRAVGAITAIRQGFDAICFLDADNWIAPDHIASLVALHRQSGAAVCTSTRLIHHINGSPLGTCAEVDGHSFVDTNCLFLSKPAFHMIAIWYEMDPRLHPVGDRVIWYQIKKQGLSTAHTGRPTVHYRSGFLVHYQQFNVSPPADFKSRQGLGVARALFDKLVSDEAVSGIPEPAQPLDRMIEQEAPKPSFVLVSLIGLSRSQWDGTIDTVIDQSKSDNLVPIFIVDKLELEPFFARKVLVEHLPSSSLRDRSTSRLEWDLYLSRRLKFLHHKWRTKRLVCFGVPLDVICGDRNLAAL